jgi:hypothetical protein
LGGEDFIESQIANFLHEQTHFIGPADPKCGDYLQEWHCSEKVVLTIRKKENCLKTSSSIRLSLVLPHFNMVQHLPRARLCSKGGIS